MSYTCDLQPHMHLKRTALGMTGVVYESAAKLAEEANSSDDSQFYFFGLEYNMLPDGIKSDFIVPGAEIKTDRGDMIGVGLSENVPSGKTPLETYNLIEEQGGLMIMPHPFTEPYGLFCGANHDHVESFLTKIKIPYMEEHNFWADALYPKGRSRAEDFIEKYNKKSKNPIRRLGGADVKFGPEYRNAYTKLASDSAIGSKEDLVCAMKEGTVETKPIETKYISPVGIVARYPVQSTANALSSLFSASKTYVARRVA